MSFKQLALFKISRPRFYSYLFGTYLLGAVCGLNQPDQLTDTKFLFYLFYFIVPANLFLYGINDVFDTETDLKNPKKKSHEYLLTNSEKLPLIISLVSIVLLSLAFFLHLSSFQSLLLSIFLFLSFGYSAPPFRFKMRPFIDAYSNVLYALPGFFGYALFTNSFPDISIVLLAFCWNAGMHVFSAVPDISADKAAHIKTTAVYLGVQKSLLFILLNWSISSFVIILLLGPVGLLSLIYPGVILYLLYSKKPAISFYWFFPYINTILGFLTFWYIFISRFGWNNIWQSSQLLW